MIGEVSCFEVFFSCNCNSLFVWMILEVNVCDLILKCC